MNLSKKVKQIWRPKSEPSASCSDDMKLGCVEVEEENSQIEEVIAEGSCSSSPRQISLTLKQDLGGEREVGSNTIMRKNRKKSKSVPSKGKGEFVWVRKKHDGATSDAGRNGEDKREMFMKGEDRVDSTEFTRESDQSTELTRVQIAVADSEVCHDLTTPNYNWACEFHLIKPTSNRDLREKGVDKIHEISKGLPEETETKEMVMEKDLEHIKSSLVFEASTSNGDQMDTQV